jgi:hypothetical protein
MVHCRVENESALHTIWASWKHSKNGASTDHYVYFYCIWYQLLRWCDWIIRNSSTDGDVAESPANHAFSTRDWRKHKALRLGKSIFQLKFQADTSQIEVPAITCPLRILVFRIHIIILDCVWNVMTHAKKPDFVFRRNGWVHLNRQGRQFSRLLAAEMCASAVEMPDISFSEVVLRVLATRSISQFLLQFPSRASPCAITFHLDSTI